MMIISLGPNCAIAFEGGVTVAGGVCEFFCSRNLSNRPQQQQ